MAQRNRHRYTIFGALFGLAFPLLALVIILWVSKDVWVLFSIVATAPLFLGLVFRFAGQRQDQVDALNSSLEDRIRERTQSIQALIDSSGQGFMSFDSGLVVGPEYSAACTDIFGRSPEGRRIDTLLFGNETVQKDFAMGLGLYFRGSAEADVIFDTFETRTDLNGRSYRIDYHAVSSGRIMVILTDITEQLRKEAAAIEESERKNLLLKAASHRRAFSHLVREGQDLRALLRDDAQPLEDKLRQVHTFKGNAGFLACTRTQHHAHEVEERLQEAMVLGSSPPLKEACSRLFASMDDDASTVMETLGPDWLQDSDTVEFTVPQWINLERNIMSRYPADRSLAKLLAEYRKIPLRKMLDRFPYLAQDLAGRLGKRLTSFDVHDNGISIDPVIFSPLVETFGHIVRNQVDHGIETSREREESGKDPGGALSIRATFDEGWYEFVFEDDGRGIDFARVAHLAREKGLLPADAEPVPGKLVHFLFKPQFTTKASSSIVSGRGIGLSAVHHEVRELGGSIKVGSIPGKGSTFTIRVPERRVGTMVSGA